jgi:hypothetical protein
MKWIKLVRFINKHRKRGCGHFRVSTTSDKIIIRPGDGDGTKLVIKYLGWTAHRWN